MECRSGAQEGGAGRWTRRKLERRRRIQGGEALIKSLPIRYVKLQAHNSDACTPPRHAPRAHPTLRMSDVLVSWCNGLNLGHTVVSLEESFSSGYLFGSLLRLYNQQHDFPSAFRDSNRTADVVANFKALQPTLVRMGIAVGAQRVEEIVHAVPGAAPRLLYEIKSKLALLERVEVGRPKPGLYKTLANLQVSGFPEYFAAVR